MINRSKAVIGIMVMTFLLASAMPIAMGHTRTGGDPQSVPDIIIDVPISTPSISTQFIDGQPWSAIELEGSLPSVTEGGPALPRISYPLKVPYDIREVRVVRSGPVELALDHPLPPSPTLTAYTSDLISSGGTSPLEPDGSRYASDDIVPEEPLSWEHMGYGWEGEERLSHYSLSIIPFDHRPRSLELTFYSNVSLEIVVEDQPVTMTRAITPPSSLQAGTELLIVAPSGYLDDLLPYTEWNREKGLVTTAVSMQVVSSTYSSMDDASSLWQYIRDSYFGDGKALRFVTLIGEVNQVPTRWVIDTNRYLPAGEPEYHAADTYFGCLDGNYQNWDGNENGVWGEKRDIYDYVQEVYVSRVPVNSESEAGGWAIKAVKYEKNPNMGSWAGKAGLFGANTHEVNDGPRQCEYLWSKWMDNVYPTKAPYYSSSPIQQSTGAPLLTYNNINTAFNDGLGIVVYMGHGHYAVWTQGTNDGPQTTIFTASTATALGQSPKLPLVVAMSCETNWFDSTSFDSISENFVEDDNGGAIAYIGAIRTTEGGIGYDQYYPGAPAIQEDVLRAISNGKRSVAEIMADAKQHYYESFGQYFFNSGDGGITYSVWMEHMVLGPAETEIWTDTPKGLLVSYDFDEDYYTNFTVEVKDAGGDPMNGARVCIYSPTLDDQVVVTTNSIGKVKVPYVISQTAGGTITVTKPGYKPYQSDILLRDSTPPVTQLDAKIPHPNGIDGWYLLDPEISFSASEPSKIHYRINGGYTYTYKDTVKLFQGINELEYWSVDSSGNAEGPQSLVIKLDTRVPGADVHLTPEEPDGLFGWYVSAPMIEVQLEDTDGSDQRVEYWYNGGERQVYDGPIIVEDGEQEIHVQASDDAGNRDVEHVFQLMVDTSCPVTDVMTNGASPNEEGWYDQPFEITLRTDDPMADILYRWNDDGPEMNYKNPILPEYGNNTLYYHSIDRAGNVEKERWMDIPYDPDVPVVKHTIYPNKPDGIDGWYTTPPRVTLSVENELYGHTIYYRLGGDQWKDYLSPVQIPEGKTTLLIYAVDAAGNRCPEIMLEYKVDSTIESTQYKVEALQGNGWYLEVPQITLTGEQGATIYFSWNDRGSERYMGTLFPPEGEGMFRLSFYCIDDAGNREPERTIDVNVDATPPTAAMTYETSENWVNFNLSGSTDGIGVAAYFIDFGDGSDSGWVNDPMIQHHYQNKGDYQVQVRVKDEAGHESDVLEGTVSLKSGREVAALLLILIMVIVISSGALALIALYKHRHSRPQRFHLPHPHLPHPHMPHPHLPHSGPPPSHPAPIQQDAKGVQDVKEQPAGGVAGMRPASSIGPDRTYQPPPPPSPPQRPRP